MLLLKVHKSHLTRSYVHTAIQNISVPYIILPFRILYYFRSVKYTPPDVYNNALEYNSLIHLLVYDQTL